MVREKDATRYSAEDNELSPGFTQVVCHGFRSIRLLDLG